MIYTVMTTTQFLDALEAYDFGKLSYSLGEEFYTWLGEVAGEDMEFDGVAIRSDFALYDAAKLTEEYSGSITLESLADDGIDTEGYDTAVACMTSEMRMNALIDYLQAKGTLTEDAVVVFDDAQVILYKY